jgi:hypothetical protein
MALPHWLDWRRRSLACSRSIMVSIMFDFVRFSLAASSSICRLVRSESRILKLRFFTCSFIVTRLQNINVATKLSRRVVTYW